MIHIFTTGGSIDKYYSTKASDFIVGEPTIETVLTEANVTVAVEVESLFQKDSLEITGSDRQLIREKVLGSRHRHIIITHGTDTMVQTAQALSGIPDKVVVLTGAMQPTAFKKSDAPFNLGMAFLAVQILPAGVYVVLNGRVFDPQNVRKNTDEDRFEAL